MAVTTDQLKPGTQIIYIPGHAEGDPDHPDAEPGFVTSLNDAGDAAFCRYWSKAYPGKLRTLANSELTPLIWLELADTHDQAEVDEWLNFLYDLQNPDHPAFRRMGEP